MIKLKDLSKLEYINLEKVYICDYETAEVLSEVDSPLQPYFDLLDSKLKESEVVGIKTESKYRHLILFVKFY